MIFFCGFLVVIAGMLGVAATDRRSKKAVRKRRLGGFALADAAGEGRHHIHEFTVAWRKRLGLLAVDVMRARGWYSCGCAGAAQEVA
jgi:hypothetical protein